MKTVALIGSRKAPSHAISTGFQIGMELAKRNIKMYSGGAPGMDDTFERGYRMINHNLMNIILPNNGFNGRTRGENYFPLEDYPIELILKAEEMVADIHPYWPLEGFARRAHTRNCFQILGHDLNSPVDCVILWAPINGVSVTGGTRTAFELARQYNIKAYNMANLDHLEELEAMLEIKHANLDFLM